jgi:DNA-binding transcriptional LysR family regulator
MRERLRAALAELRGAARLVASDVPAAALGAALTAELAKRAPGADLIFHPWHARDEVARPERGEVDLAVLVASGAGKSRRSEPLGTYPYAVVMRRDHPAAAAGTFDLDCRLAFPNVVVSGRWPIPLALEPVALHLVRRQPTDMDPAVTLAAELVRARARIARAGCRLARPPRERA